MAIYLLYMLPGTGNLFPGTRYSTYGTNVNVRCLANPGTAFIRFLSILQYSGNLLHFEKSHGIFLLPSFFILEDGSVITDH